MDCSHSEQMLSEYLDSTLSPDERLQLEEHLESCSRCAALLAEMRSVIDLCRSTRTLEVKPELVDSILLRTSGRSRTRSLREFLRRYLNPSLATPRFAVGTSLAAIFLILTAYTLMPRASAARPHFSPLAVLQLMERQVQHLYGQGIKAYEKANELQAQFFYFTDNAINKARFMMETMEVPAGGAENLAEPAPGEEKTPREKQSGLPFFSGSAAALLQFRSISGRGASAVKCPEPEQLKTDYP